MSDDTDHAVIATIDAVRSRASTQETLLVLAVPVEFAAKVASFLPMIGQQVAVAFAAVDGGKVAQKRNQPQKRENLLAQDLMRAGYFRNPKLWDALDENLLYTAQSHKRFIEGLPCCGIKFAPSMRCDGDVVAHHVKSAANSGVWIKPEHFYCVPLCHNHHANWAHGSHSGSASREDKQTLLEHAVSLSADQAKVAVKKYLAIASLADITETMLKDFEREVLNK